MFQTRIPFLLNSSRRWLNSKADTGLDRQSATYAESTRIVPRRRNIFETLETLLTGDVCADELAELEFPFPFGDDDEIRGFSPKTCNQFQDQFLYRESSIYVTSIFVVSVLRRYNIATQICICNIETT